MFIFDFVAETILDQILDWIYGKIIGFLNDFFVMMNNMGVELFELPWVEAVTTFFSYFGWALFGVGLVVGAFECTIEYQGGRGSIKDTAMNYIKGFMAVSLFTVVPVNLYSLCVSLQGTFGSAITGITNAESIGLTAQQVLMSASFPGIGNPILMTFCAVMMGYAVIKVFFANLKRGGILLIQIAVGSLYMFSVPRGYIDGFIQWCKQVIGICITAFLQSTILTAGLMVFKDHPLLGLGLMLSSTEVPRIAGQFGLDTSTKTNIMSSVYAAQTAINMTRTVVKTVTAASNLQDVTTIISTMHRNREPLLHTAVFLELSAPDMEKLKLLQTEVLTELIRSKLNVDKLLLRQKQGFLCVHPAGRNVFREQFERALPASSVANLFPFNYSGKTDKNGFYIGRDKFGSNVIVDFNQRADDKTNANILILGNSGQGKSYLLKLILTILRQSGMKVICLDPEHEYIDLTNNLGGCFVDLMSGEYIINVLEPKTWDENGSPEDTDAPYTFRCSSRLSQHISFLKDFFGTYKNFTDSQIDTIEIMLGKLYEKWNIRDDTDFSKLTPTDYPILSDLYDLMEEEYRHYDAKKKELYTAELLQEICLGLHSMCKGAESKFFDGHTNITDSSFLTFGVKGLLQASRNVKDAMLFNILSYMSNELLTNGHTAASIDEFYLFLTNLTAVEYIRNFMKRVRKKDSAVILASQNLEDFNIDGIREYTKPLFSIPTHAFLFNAGNIDAKFYIDTLQLEKSEYNLIRYPQRGVCLYKCGNERYNLMVHAPEYKEKLFGSAGGR